MNAQPALDLIKDWSREGIDLSVERLRQLHARVLEGSISAPSGGTFRGQAPSDNERIEAEVAAWVTEFNDECRERYRLRDDFLAALADLHVRFHRIAPFAEGNGRTNRLLAFFFSLRHQRELVIVHDSYYRIIMRLCREEGSSTYFFKYLRALGDEEARRGLLEELDDRVGWLA